MARFCFISGRGKYEFEIDFDRKYGEPQLLLYYDDKTQWPSVYKSGKVSTVATSGRFYVNICVVITVVSSKIVGAEH